jgi:hypothetical protein
VNWEVLGRKDFVVHLKVLDRQSSIPEIDTAIIFLTHVQKHSKNPQRLLPDYYGTRSLDIRINVHGSESLA